MELLNWKILIGCFLLGGCTTLFIGLQFCRCEYLKKDSTFDLMNVILTWVHRLWYPFILAVSTTYVLCNFSDCLDFQLFSDFQGDNLIFFICIFLWLLPLVERFEIFGANFKLKWQSERSKQAADEAIQTQGTKNAEQLKTMIAGKEEKNHVEQ